MITLTQIANLNIKQFIQILLKKAEKPFFLHKYPKEQFYICKLEDISLTNQLEKPHIYDFYTIYFVELGSLIKTNQLDTIWLQSGEMFISKPSDINAWKKTDYLKGYLLAFTSDFLLLLINNQDVVNNFDYLDSSSEKKIILNESNFEYYLHIFKELIKEYSEPNFQSTDLIRLLIFVVLIKTNRLNLDKVNDIKSMRVRRSYDVIYKNFIKLLDESYFDLVQNNSIKPRKVKEYAILMNLNPAYLGECIRKSSGKSAKSIINARTMLFAKCQLLYTNKNVSEIAFELDFESSGYFIQFFKKYANKTPLEFRNSASFS